MAYKSVGNVMITGTRRYLMSIFNSNNSGVTIITSNVVSGQATIPEIKIDLVDNY